MSKLTLVTGARDITMKRHFDAPRKLVFEAYSSCEHIQRWWGPRTWPTEHCRMDFRPERSRACLLDQSGRMLCNHDFQGSCRPGTYPGGCSPTQGRGRSPC